MGKVVKGLMLVWFILFAQFCAWNSWKCLLRERSINPTGGKEVFGFSVGKNRIPSPKFSAKNLVAWCNITHWKLKIPVFTPCLYRLARFLIWEFCLCPLPTVEPFSCGALYFPHFPLFSDDRGAHPCWESRAEAGKIGPSPFFCGALSCGALYFRQ